jgi:hypothetical protein
LPHQKFYRKATGSIGGQFSGSRRRSIIIAGASSRSRSPRNQAKNQLIIEVAYNITLGIAAWSPASHNDAVLICANAPRYLVGNCSTVCREEESTTCINEPIPLALKYHVTTFGGKTLAGLDVVEAARFLTPPAASPSHCGSKECSELVRLQTGLRIQSPAKFRTSALKNSCLISCRAPPRQLARDPKRMRLETRSKLDRRSGSVQLSTSRFRMDYRRSPCDF